MTSAAQPALWRRVGVVAALMVAAFTFNTAENLPIGLLTLLSDDLGTSLGAVGILVTGYGVTVAVASLPLAHATRSVPRRHLLTALLAALAAANAVAAVVPSYALMFTARVVTALAQALFWAVMGPVAVGLFPERVRGRVLGVLSVAGSLAMVLGVPAGTWLGRHYGREAPFAVLAGAAAVSMLLVAALLPATRPEEGHGSRGTRPDRRRFAVVLATTALSVTGAFAGYTYVVEFLGEVGGFSDDSVSALLTVPGVAGVIGVSVAGPLLDRYPRATLAVPVATQAAGMLGLYAFGDRQAAAVAFLAVLGASLGPVFMATQARVLESAPGRTEVALAANSGAFNAGVAVGALLGGALLPLAGVRGTFLAGGLLTLAALTALLGERLLPAAAPRGPAISS
ncbi:transporter [Streptomyces mobaraensis NBRC 13819 = DSM 40847]|uniref:Transporter n=1 Tax=Streptomyces mobaraensis (strain ATCC 29032 / DSM 40847 / JCM 4168 / NBRC 13819 / NCIMB 11159 / IPCR 16-22) TaxID=1223523 RepID=M3CAP5_STRM1|nr:MFS transporter [Streptomyces mobaraensis]EMF01137.1 transporter [Streptomyces mobaraensis NBRC 13819 = DSM 40847]